MFLKKPFKLIVIILLLCEFLFLIRAFVLYSFYTNDEMYGDGLQEADKYNLELLKLVVYSLSITSVLIGLCLFISKNSLKNKP